MLKLAVLLIVGEASQDRPNSQDFWRMLSVWERLEQEALKAIGKNFLCDSFATVGCTMCAAHLSYQEHVLTSLRVIRYRLDTV